MTQLMTEQGMVRVPAGTWVVDPAHSSVAFEVKHMMISTVRGQFREFDGTLEAAEDDPADSRVRGTAKVASIDTGSPDRDEHLKGPDFFDAARYPVITFVSDGFSKSSATSYSVRGKLTMHGVTRPVTLAVTAPPPFNHAGGTRRGIEATTSVNRKDFGLLWEFPGEGAGVVVGDSIKITIDAELVLQPEPSQGG